MMLLLKKYVNTVLLIITVPLTLFLLLLPRAAFTVSFCAYYFVQAHRETWLCCASSTPEAAFLQLQELSKHNITKTGSVSAALLSTPSSNLRLSTSSPRPPALRINLNIDCAPIASHTHTHLSHSPTSRLLSTSLSLGIPFPHSTEYVRDFNLLQLYLLVSHCTDSRIPLLFIIADKARAKGNT